MFQQLVPVNKERHAAKKVKRIESFDFASRFNLASVMVHEVARAAAIYPIVFIDDKGEFRPVALLGLEPGENLFVDASGRWHASYVPAIIRRYPFGLTTSGREGQFTVCIDEGSPLVTDSEGAALFTDKGEPTEVIENVKRYLGELQQMDAFTREFCRFLRENELLTPLTMRVRRANEVKNIAGCHVVNEEKLNKISDEKFLELRRRSYLPPIYAHLVSLSQLERLLMLKEEKVGGVKGAKPGVADDEPLVATS